MNDKDLARYFELVAKMKAGTLDQTKCEHLELKALAAEYAAKLKDDLGKEQDETQKRLLEDAAARQEADEKTRSEQATQHQLSWLKSVINPAVDDEKLRVAWESFRGSVEG